MTNFTDGPAAGLTLSLSRSPMFLRVVIAPDGKMDALDQLEDRAAANEKIVVYQLVKSDGHVHVCGSRSGKRWGGWYAIATYAVLADQPEEATVRVNTVWQKWALAKAEARA